MKLTDLSLEDQALVLAFVEIARDECADRTWAEMEPMLAKCWANPERNPRPVVKWADVAPFIRAACEKDNP